MKMSVLLHITFQEECYMAQTCWTDIAGQNLKTIATNKDEAIHKMQNLLMKYIELQGKQYIKSNASFGMKINCPEGHIELPIDVWHCKDTGKSCPMQAQINVTEYEYFYENCSLTEEKKDKIWSTLINRNYDGFHHMPGRYLCGLCDKSGIYFNYHYPWELTSLSMHCDIESMWGDIERVKQLIRNNFPRSAKYTKLCPECFCNVISKFLPEIDLSDYKIFTYDYNRSKTNMLV